MVAVTALIHSSVKYTQLARRKCRVYTLLLGQECIAIMQQLQKFLKLLCKSKTDTVILYSFILIHGAQLVYKPVKLDKA